MAAETMIDELLEEELAKFVSIHKPDAAHMPVIRQFFKAYVTDGAIRTIVDSREFGRLADSPKLSLADVRALDHHRLGRGFSIAAKSPSQTQPWRKITMIVNIVLRLEAEAICKRQIRFHSPFIFGI